MLFPDLLLPLRAGLETVLAVCHDVLITLGLPAPAGSTWLLAIALLVVLVRIALLPLVVRQYRSGRRMRQLAPDLRRIRERHSGRRATDREALARETAALYRDRGVHPLASLLPMLVQIPLFIGLVQALEHAARGSGSAALASFATAALFGVPLAATALSGGLPGVVTGVGLLVITAGAQVCTQQLAVLAAGPDQSMPGARLLLVLPLVTALTGLAFPIGVTAYWCCSALWTLGQQAVLTRLVLRRAPVTD